MPIKRLYVLICIIVGCAAFVIAKWHHGADFARYYVDFDISMQTGIYPQRLAVPIEKHFYDVFKRVYEKNSPLKVIGHKGKIPKIIHQIWLGSPFPEKYHAFQASWKKYHPDWEYWLWTDKELATFPLRHRELFESSINYGEKSDIARYEILYQIGGLYVDTDFECLKPFDVLHGCYDFYIGIQPLDTNMVQLGIGLIGSVPGHALLQCCLDNLEQNAARTRQIIQRTGPIYFTQIFASIAPQLHDATVALPPTFFYPRGYNQSDIRTVWERPESFAVHHWEGSWMKKDAFVTTEGQ